MLWPNFTKIVLILLKLIKLDKQQNVFFFLLLKVLYVPHQSIWTPSTKDCNIAVCLGSQSSRNLSIGKHQRTDKWLSHTKPLPVARLWPGKQHPRTGGHSACQADRDWCYGWRDCWVFSFRTDSCAVPNRDVLSLTAVGHTGALFSRQFKSRNTHCVGWAAYFF